MSDGGPLLLYPILGEYFKNRDDHFTSPNNEEVPWKSWCQSDEKWRHYSLNAIVLQLLCTTLIKAFDNLFWGLFYSE